MNLLGPHEVAELDDVLLLEHCGVDLVEIYPELLETLKLDFLDDFLLVGLDLFRLDLRYRVRWLREAFSSWVVVSRRSLECL